MKRAVNPRTKLSTDKFLAIIKTIIKSPDIREYKIGITKDSPRRRSEYIAVGYDHYVIIETRLPASGALELEEDLFKLLTTDRRSLTYRKYRKMRRDGSNRRSLGGSPPKASDRYDVYIAWIGRS